MDLRFESHYLLLLGLTTPASSDHNSLESPCSAKSIEREALTTRRD
jgi:hypothetical protein